MINLHAISEFDDVATGLAAVDYLIPIGDAAGVHGMYHSHLDVANRLRASLIHLRYLLDALAAEPVAQFRYCYHRRIVLLRNLNRVADMVEVPVSAEQNIDLLHFLFRFRALRVAHDPRIDYDNLAAGSLNAESCVT